MAISISNQKPLQLRQQDIILPLPAESMIRNIKNIIITDSNKSVEAKVRTEPDLLQIQSSFANNYKVMSSNESNRYVQEDSQYPAGGNAPFNTKEMNLHEELRALGHALNV